MVRNAKFSFGYTVNYGLGHVGDHDLDDDDGKHIRNYIKMDDHLTAGGFTPRYLDKPRHY